MIRFTPLPSTLDMRHPVALIATWFGAGLIKPAPGTWGTLAAVPFAIAIVFIGGAPLLAIASVAAFAAGIWAAGRYCTASGVDDASEIVIDEVAAIWLVLAALPMTPLNWIAGIVLFRLFDIVKPWPIGAVERRFKGGFGVMADDIVAAFFAIVAFILVDVLLQVVFA